MTPRDTVLEGFLALVREFPAMLERYSTQVAALDTAYAERKAALVSLDEAKKKVDADADRYRAKLTEAIESDIAERAKARQSIADGIATLQRDRQDLLNDLATKRAELSAMQGETNALLLERQVALDAINAQIASATTKHQRILDDIAAVVRQHGGVSA